MRTIGQAILRARVLLIASIALLTVMFGMALPGLQVREDESTWLASDNPARIQYDHFKELFGFDRFIVVAYATPGAFEKSEIEYLDHLTQVLGELPYVEDAVSLTSVEETVVVGGSSFTRDFLRASDAPHTEAQMLALDNRVSSNPFVEGTLISGDRHTIGIVLEIESSLSGAVYTEITHALEDALDSERSLTGREFYYGGGPVSDAKVTETMNRDMLLFMPLSLLVAGIMLFVLFRSWRCMAIPLISVVIGIEWTFGLKAMTGSPVTPVSTTLIALIIIVGVANSVHFISHYRLELTRSDSQRQAMLDTFARAGTPCFLTSLTTAVGFGSLVVSSIPLIRNLGAFAAFGIMSAFVLTMVLLPVGLGGASIPRSAAVRKSQTWESFGALAVQHSRALILFGIIFAVAISMGGLRIQIEPSMTNYLKPSSPARQAADFFDSRLSGSSSIELLLEGPPGVFESTEVLRSIEHLQASVQNHAYVARSYSIVDYIKSVNGSSIPGTDAGIGRAISVLERAKGVDLTEYYVQGEQDATRISIRTKQMQLPYREAIVADIEDFASRDLPDVHLTVTGADGLVNSITVDIVRTQIYSVVIAMAVILGLMLLSFGPKGALAAVLPNIIPIALLFGFMGIAGIELNIATITVAAICMGLVVDDTIHYFAHFRRIVLLTGDRKSAAQETLHEVGSALASTTLTLVLGFAVFTLSDSAFLMQFGFLACGALIVAFLADITISPAILASFDVFAPKSSRKSTRRKPEEGPEQ